MHNQKEGYDLLCFCFFKD